MTSSVPYDELNVPIRRFHITEDKFGWIVFFFFYCCSVYSVNIRSNTHIYVNTNVSIWKDDRFFYESKQKRKMTS